MTFIMIEYGTMRAEEHLVIQTDDFFGPLMLLAGLRYDRFMKFYFEILHILSNGVGG